MTADAVGGVWTYAIELARGLRQRGIQVILATMGAPLSASQRQEASHIPDLELFESTYKLEWMQDPWDDLEKSGEWLLELKDRFEPDLVHVNGYVHAALPWDAPVLVVAHSCVLTWWAAVTGEKPSISLEPYRDAVVKGLQSADLVVAPSRAMLTSLIQQYGAVRSAKVIPNGLRQEPQRGIAKENLVLSVGRLWDDAKNIRMLEKVARELTWPVYVAGDSDHPENGRTQWNDVRLLGKLSRTELAPWFGRASIYALPARYEPFGFTPLEAAMAGCALVLGNIPSMREMWSGAALFVSPDDGRELKDTLNMLAVDEEHRRALAEKALTRSRNFTTEQMAAGYIDAYRSLID